MAPCRPVTRARPSSQSAQRLLVGSHPLFQKQQVPQMLRPVALSEMTLPDLTDVHHVEEQRQQRRIQEPLLRSSLRLSAIQSPIGTPKPIFVR